MSGDDSALEGAIADRLVDDAAVRRSDLVELVRSIDPLRSHADVDAVVDRVWSRAHGLGVIESLLADNDVTEVMINGTGPVWVDRGDRLVRTKIEVNERDLAVLVERIVEPLGLRVDRSSPIVDARLADGSRVNIVLPPLAVGGATITIRRFVRRGRTLADFGPPEMCSILERAVAERRNIIVSGGTGAGKTTLLNALGSVCSRDERIVVIEDTTELALPGRHIVQLESRPANSEGVGEVTIRDLVRTALRMRPDRIVVGEVRGGEALDLVLALNTGHSGSLATCHANSPAAALDRLRNLALLADVGLPAEAVTAEIRSAVNLVVQVSRTQGVRRVETIAEVAADQALRVLWPMPESAELARGASRIPGTARYGAPECG